MRRFTSVAAVACSATFAVAQPVNIDFGATSGAPDASYGGGGRPGHWNTITRVTFEPQPLLDIAGQPSGVSIAADYFEIEEVGSINDPGTAGNDEALLDDFLPGYGDVAVVFRLEGLTPGVYQVVTYGWGPGQTRPHPVLNLFDGACVGFFEDAEGPELGGGCMAGPWPGHLEEGVTHIVNRIEVTSGVLHIQYFGSYWGASGFLNGLQVAPEGSFTDPNPPCLCDADGDDVSSVFDLLTYLDDWFAGNADLNADSATDVHDLLTFLDCFFAGC